MSNVPTTPAEYRPLWADAGHPSHAKTGYCLLALRRELDWHSAVRRADPSPTGRAATVAELTIREAIDKWLAFTFPADGCVEWARDWLRSAAEGVHIGADVPFDVDVELRPYFADAARRLAFIVEQSDTLPDAR